MFADGNVVRWIHRREVALLDATIAMRTGGLFDEGNGIGSWAATTTVALGLRNLLMTGGVEAVRLFYA